MADITDSGELNGQLATASPKLIHLTAQRPKVKGRRLPKRQGTLPSSKDQSQTGGVVTLITDSPKLSHPTAERPRVKGRRPPKRYASPQPVENARPIEPQATSLEDLLTEYENTIQLIVSDTTETKNKCLTIRNSVKTMITLSVENLTRKAGKGGVDDGTTVCEGGEFEQLASQLEAILLRFEELMERERASFDGVEGQQEMEALRNDLDEVRTQKRDLNELCAIQRTLHEPQNTLADLESQPNVNENVGMSDNHDINTSDPLMHDDDSGTTESEDDDTELISKEIRRLPPLLSHDEDTQEQGQSTEVVSMSVHSRMVGFDTGRGTGEQREEMLLEQDERTPLLVGSTKDESTKGGKLCDCCVIL